MVDVQNQVFELLKKQVRPEFLNRIDELIMFAPLLKEQIRDIVGLQFKLVANKLDKQGVRISITDTALDELANIGFDPQYGARPVKRAIQTHLLNELSREIIAGRVDNTSNILIDYQSNDFVFKND